MSGDERCPGSPDGQHYVRPILDITDEAIGDVCSWCGDVRMDDGPAS